MACFERIRGLDIFGQPVSLVYKGEPTFQTKCGGCVALMLTLFIGITFAQNILGWIQNEDYSQVIESKFVTYGADKKPWVLDTNQYTLAGLVELNSTLTAEKGYQAEQLARVQFYAYQHWRNEDGTDSDEHTFVPAARCNELYTDNLTLSSDFYNSVMAIEFNDRDWICPNITNFTLS